MKWINDVVFAILAAHVKDFTVNQENFPDFEAYVNEMKEKGIHLVPIIDAGVKVEAGYDVYEEWGSLMLFVWLQAVKRLEDKGYTRLLFYLLRAVIVAYLLPLGLGVVLIINEAMAVFNGTLFRITPVISMIGLLLFMIWILGFFANFESLQEKWDMTRHCFSDALPASRERQLRFQEICRQTKMRPGRVILCEKAGIRCGGITVGVIHPRIVLPEGKTDEFVERVTMIHELVHYTRKDIWFLTAAKVVEAIHWFNPWTRGLAAQMSQWNEYACDWKVCNKYLGNIKSYLEVLYRVSMQGQEDKTDLYYSIGTQPMKLIGRMEKMINMKNAMKRPKFFGVLAAVAVSFTSAGSALASTGILAGGYHALYDVLPIDGYTSEKDQSDIELAASANFSWNLPTDYIKSTKDFLKLVHIILQLEERLRQLEKFFA